WCWGRNRAGELGALAAAQSCESQACVEKPTKVEGLPAGMASVSLGLAHACARTVAGVVYCWGDNAFGRLGRGDLDPAPAPAVVKDLPPASQVTIAGDQYGHTCALAGSTVYCWGYNEHLSLGRSNASDPDCGGG